MEEDKGRQVPWHRSGGGMRVASGGRSGLALAAMLAMAAGTGALGVDLPIVRRPGDDDRRYAVWPPRQEPDDRGRRAEKDAIALAKAEAKRQRKAAKRAKNKTPNAEAQPRP